MTHRLSSRIPIGLFLVVLGGYLLFSPAHFLTSPDEQLNLRTTLSLLQGYGGAIPSLEGFASKIGKEGREYAQYGLGLPLASLPWCALGTALDPSENAQESNSLAHYFDSQKTNDRVGTLFLQGWMSIFNMIVSGLTVVLVFSLLQRLDVSMTNAIFLSLLLAFGCYMWPHGRTFFTEPLAAFCLLMAIELLVRAQDRSYTGFWILGAGLFWAGAVLTRLDSMVTVPAAAWFLLVQPNTDKIALRIDFKKLILFAIPWIAVLGIILLYNQYRFGSLVSTGYEDQPEKIRFLTPLLVGLQGFLFTPGRSLFLYSPPLLFALGGILRFWRKDAWLAGGVLLIVAGYLGAMSKWQNWAGGYDWGPRHIYQITPFLAIASSAWMGKKNLFDHSAKRIGWAVFVLISLFIQILGLSADSVLTIKWFLARMQQTFPPNSVDYISPYLLQLPVYLPQFSSLSLHWQWMTSHGPDFLLLTAAAEYPTRLFLFLIPIVMLLCGGILLRNSIHTMRK